MTAVKNLSGITMKRLGEPGPPSRPCRHWPGDRRERDLCPLFLGNSGTLCFHVSVSSEDGKVVVTL